MNTYVATTTSTSIRLPLLGRPSACVSIVGVAMLLASACGDDSAAGGAASTGSTGTADSSGPTTMAPGTTEAVDSSDGGSTGSGSEGGTDSSGGGTTEGSTGDDTDGDSSGSEESSTGEPVVEAPPWLVHLLATGGGLVLYQVDIETAATTEICTVVDSVTMAPFDGFAYSVTFTRDDRLMFSSGAHLWEVELPSCMATNLGAFGVGDVFAIAPDEDLGLFGVSAATDEVLRIDPDDGSSTVVGPLGSDWFTLGATWNETEQQLLGLSGNTDSLYDLDIVTGEATLLQALGVDFFQVGFEYHSLTDLSYACTDDAHLLRIEVDGSITDLGDMGFADCLNLGAPWSDASVLPPPA